MKVTIAEFDALPTPAAADSLRACCGSSAWVSAMLERRPFRSPDAVLRAADEVWARLTPDDWREAFTHHPRIGERVASADTGGMARDWSAGEQSRVSEAQSAVQRELADVQHEYEARFGHIFLICAAGQSAADILTVARRRLRNDAATELRIAADEQRKITRLRLERLLVEPAEPARS